MLRLPEWDAQGRIPVPVEIDGEPYAIPGLPPIAPLEMDRTVQGDKEGSEVLLYHAKCLWRAAGVLVNSVFKLEASIIKGLQDVPPHSYQGNQVSESWHHQCSRLSIAFDGILGFKALWMDEGGSLMPPGPEKLGMCKNATLFAAKRPTCSISKCQPTPLGGWFMSWKE
jgi:hypothetical protein